MKSELVVSSGARASDHDVLRLDEIASYLDDDWSFAALSRSETLWGPHGYHRYPAKFIPQLVRRLIELYSVPGELVGDTFVGSATTGIEALRTGRRFWGADINPVALLISRAKCTPLAPEGLGRAWITLEERLQHLPRIGRRSLTSEEREVIQSIDVVRAPVEERFNYWFPVQHRQVLDAIFQVILKQTTEPVETFFLCAFSNILRRTSIWLSGSTKPQKDLEKVLPDPVEEFRRQAQDMVKRNALYWNDLVASSLRPWMVPTKCQITRADARQLPLSDGALDFLVTSPPYATCYEYSDLHRLTQLWFSYYGLLPADALDTPFIGSSVLSRRSTERQAKQDLETGSSLADAALRRLEECAVGRKSGEIRGEVRQLRYYFQDMHTALQESARVVACGKRMALIVGDSRRRGVIIPTSAAICQMAGNSGFELERRIVRRIPARVLTSTRDEVTGRFSSTTQSTSQAYPEEDVLIFRRRS